MALKKTVIRKVAKKFALQNNLDIDIFNKHWELFKKSHKFKNENIELLNSAINDSIYYLFRHLLVFGNSYYRGVGLLKRAPIDEKYVIFSDHHYLPNNNRHNYFQQHTNYNLYRGLLEQYYQEGYTLVENGDVEDLIIYEPSLNNVERRINMTWHELQEERLQRRSRQLRRIISDYNDLYDQIRDTFYADDKFVKLAGNHDVDIQEGELLEILRGKYKDITVYDVLTLETDPTINLKKSHFPYIIAHGHQFDKSTHPLYAQYIGEVFSECLGWAFEGADRFWKWKDDGPREWVEGNPFNNILASGEPGEIGEIIEGLIDDYEVAWEYFDNFDNPSKAITEEVMKGKRFFKFRHLSEIFVREKLEEYFPDPLKRPTLVLGHTHEVRLNPFDAHRNNTFTNIANSGSAGRFANLIWALEIDRGQTRIVSWHYRMNRPHRQVYRIGTERIHNRLSNGGSPYHTSLHE
jgi:hypothetical protein